MHGKRIRQESERYHMRNTIEERDDYFAPVDYAPLLKVIASVLKAQSTTFQVTGSGNEGDRFGLQLNLDAIALAVAKKASNLGPTFTPLYGTTYSTVNFESLAKEKAFSHSIGEIKKLLQTQIEQAFKQAGSYTSLSEAVNGLLMQISTLNTNKSAHHLHYPFIEKKALRKRRLHMQAMKAGGVNDVRLKGHKLTITVKNIHEFEDELVEGLCNKLEEVCNCSSQDIQRKRDRLKRSLDDESSELRVLSRLLRRESLGRLHKEAKICYLDYLRTGMEQWQERSEEGVRYLHLLIHRLRLLEAFINDEASDDARYQVSYSECSANYRDLFARADAYDTLPIVPEIEGSLGETTNKEKGEQVFIAGLKLKLNGHVQSHNSVFDYYASLLDPDNKEHQEQIDKQHSRRQFFAEKVLKIALLYYFVFSHPDDEVYDPRQDVERDVLMPLKSGDLTLETDVLRRLKNQWSMSGKKDAHGSVSYALSTLKNALEAFLKVRHIGPDAENAALHLVVENGLLDEDANRMQMESLFFRADAMQDHGRTALKYVSVQDADAGASGFCTLPVSMNIEPMYYFSSSHEDVEQFDMQYAVNGYRTLPAIFIPSDKESKTLCEDYYRHYSRVVIYYSSKLPFKYDDPEAFMYRFTLLLLSYFCLKLLCDSVNTLIRTEHQRLFVPVVRIHKNKKTEQEARINEEATISSISKVVSHMIANEYFSNAQGFHIDVLKVSGTNYKLTNGLSSLYTALPKAFTLMSKPGLEKLAVILVSSRKCDANNSSTNYLASVYGEVIGIGPRRNTPNSIFVETLRTFADYTDSKELYRSPIAIRNQIRQCYEEGYRHILYIAQAPYTSTLHITGAEEQEEQFFMSKEVIQFLTDGYSDLNVYPLYCDKYYVVKVGNANPEAESLYVDELRELRTLFSDPNHSSIVFFNLFNGYAVPDRGQEKRTFYNGVLSYATLVNVYDDPIHDQAIRNNLLDGKQIGSLKQDFLHFLTLLHFSRYEKSERDGKKIFFKLEPYQNIIGSESVGPLSLLSHHTIQGVRFNSLAFLTAVRKSLNKERVNYKELSADEDVLDSNEGE